MKLTRFRPLMISLAFLLFVGRPASADNYTPRAGDSRKSAAITPAPEKPEFPHSDPEPIVEEPAALVPEIPPAVPLEEEPTPAAPEASVPDADFHSREAPAAGTEPGSAPASAPAPASAALPLTVVPVEPPPPPKLEKVWLDGKLPEGAETEGDWIWVSGPSAGEALVHSHPSGKGMRNHRFSGEPVEMPGNGMVVQQVWLDPQDPPQGIALRFKLATDEEVGVYWEGEKEVFTPNEYEELWYYGMLPELGKWVSLEVLAEDLGLEDSRIVGVGFATFDGRALWGRTVITEAPPLEGEREGAGPPVEVPSLIPDVSSN